MELAEKSAVDIQGGISGSVTTDSDVKGIGPLVSVDKVSHSSMVGVNFKTSRQNRPMKDIECWYCKAKGHMQRQCQQYHAEKEKRRQARNHRKPISGTVKNMDDSESDTEAEMFTVFKLHSKEKPYLVTVSLDGVPVEMEVDTGASLTVISEETLKSLRRSVNISIQRCNRRLKTYTGKEIPMLGSCQCVVTYKGGMPVTRDVIVVSGRGPNLLGRDWLQHLKLDWSEIFSMQGETSAINADLEQILKENAAILEEIRGTIKGSKLPFC